MFDMVKWRAHLPHNGEWCPQRRQRKFFLNWMLANSKNDMIFIQTWHITVKLKLKIKLNIIYKPGKAHLICAASQARALDLEAARLDYYRVKPLWRCLKTRTCSRSLGHLGVANQGKCWWWNLFHQRGVLLYKQTLLWIFGGACGDRGDTECRAYMGNTATWLWQGILWFIHLWGIW